MSQDKFLANTPSDGDEHRVFVGHAVRAALRRERPQKGMGGGVKQQWTSPSALSDPDAKSSHPHQLQPLPTDQSVTGRELRVG